MVVLARGDGVIRRSVDRSGFYKIIIFGDGGWRRGGAVYKVGRRRSIRHEVAQIDWRSIFGKSHNALGYSTFLCYPDLGVLQIGIRARQSGFCIYAVTYTSVYTDSEPGRAFWGADDEEISDGGILRVIVYGYDGLPMQPVALPSPDYIPGPEDPQTPPVPQDEDEREPMFIQD
ncbi:hypothetical protein Tco_1329855 [Tanacetum coccineum]